MENTAKAVKLAALWIDGIYVTPEPEILPLVIDQANRMRYALLNAETYSAL